MKQLVAILLLLTGCLFAATAQEPDEEDPYFLLCGEADAAIARGEYKEAADRLWDAIMLKPNAPGNLLLRTNLGLIYSYLDMDSLALSTLDEVIALAPAMKTARTNRARVLLKLGRDPEALLEYDTILTQDSLHAESLFYRGMMALYAGVGDVAQHDLTLLAQVEPKSLMTAQALSALYSMTGRHREAVPYFKTLLAEEKSPEYYAGLANCYIELEEYNEASALLNEGIATFADDPELYYYRALLNKRRYRPDEARADFATARRLGLNPLKQLE